MNSLYKAAAAGDLPEVQRAVELGADVRARGNRCVRKASANGREAVVRFLVECGADISAIRLEDVAGGGHVAVLRYIIDRLGVFAVSGFDLERCMKSASAAGHAETVQYLVGLDRRRHALGIANEANMLQVCARNASANGHEALLRYCVSLGADVRAGANECARRASANGHVAVVRYAAELGADIRANCDECIKKASANGHMKMMRLLVELDPDIIRDRGAECMQIASKNGRLGIMRYWSVLGVDLRGCGNASVLGAARNGHLDAVRYLLLFGWSAQPGVMEKCLVLAAQYSHAAVAQFLIASGVDYCVLKTHCRERIYRRAGPACLDCTRYLVSVGVVVSGTIVEESFHAAEPARCAHYLAHVRYLIDLGVAFTNLQTVASVLRIRSPIGIVISHLLMQKGTPRKIVLEAVDLVVGQGAAVYLDRYASARARATRGRGARAARSLYFAWLPRCYDRRRRAGRRAARRNYATFRRLCQ